MLQATPLRAALEAAGISQAEVGRRACVTRSHICHAVAGRRRLGTRTQARIALILGLPINVLFPPKRRGGEG